VVSLFLQFFKERYRGGFTLKYQIYVCMYVCMYVFMHACMKGVWVFACVVYVRTYIFSWRPYVPLRTKRTGGGGDGSGSIFI
jgi:hypothetical protein